MKISELETIVYNKKPELKKLVALYGEESYETYLKNNARVRNTSPDVSMTIFWKAYEHLIRTFFDSRMYFETKDALTKNFFASTADHGGPLCHPFFSNAFFARADMARQENQELVFTLPCSSVSLDNSSFPRGLFFHDENLHVVKLPLKSLRYRHESVYATKPYTTDDIQHIQEKISALTLSPARKHLLRNLITNVFAPVEQYQFDTYDEQMVRANWKLTKYIQGYESIEYISFSQEMLVRELILQGSDTLIPLQDMLYNKEVQKEYLEHFADIDGAHSKNNKKGTHLFWGLTNRGVRFPLYIQEDGWYRQDGTLYIRRNKEAVRVALENNHLFPCMSLCFIVLTFIHGLGVGGGFCQINYLGDMKKAYTILEKKFNWPHQDTPKTNIFTGEYIGHVLEKNGKKIPATLVDVILYQKDTTLLEWKNSISTTPLRDSIFAMMPEYYKIITGKTVTNLEFPLPPPTIHIAKKNDNTP